MSSDTPGRPEPTDVVVGIDGSPSARTAAPWAAAEADRLSRPPHLVHHAHCSVETVPVGFGTRGGDAP
ncbi:hypothetical protein [Streptomyces hydrogenans]|uniref:hypothetical protein n=1 Tax=Streptomyces hydrogenans TaxID=1873719 RepID=UPI0036E47347